MTNDKPELSSEELLRQSREALGSTPDLGQLAATDDLLAPPAAPSVDDLLAAPPGPTVDDLLAGAPPLPSASIPSPADLAPMPSETLSPQSPTSESLSSASLLPSNVNPQPPPIPVDPGQPVPARPQAWTPTSAPSPPPASPPPPRARTAPSHDLYPTESPQPQSSGAPGLPPPPNAAANLARSGAGTPAPPPSLGFQQQQRTPLPPHKPKRNIPWGPVIAIVVIGGLALIGAIAGRDTTSANRLGVGDCFENPGFGDFTTVDDQQCGELHDIQIFARVKNVQSVLLNDPENLNAVGIKCEDELLQVLGSTHMQDPTIIIPDDATMGWLSDPDTSSLGDVLCTIESPSGALVGSVLP